LTSTDTAIMDEIMQRMAMLGMMGESNGDADNDNDNLEAILRMTKEAAKAVQEGKGPPPVYEAILEPPFLAAMRFKIVHANNKRQAEQHNQRHHQRQADGTEQRVFIRHSTRPSFEHGMPSELSDLKPIRLREVARKVNYVHSTRVLFLKTVEDPTLIVGLSTIVIDEDHDFMQLSLYNFLSDRDLESPEEILPAGTFLALMAPYMRNSQDNREHGTLLIRCDNPHCVVLFDSKEEWIAAKGGKKILAPHIPTVSATMLREDGNRAFAEMKFRTAIQLYSKALKHPYISDNDRVKCLGNRAEAFLRRGQWEYAERDAREILDDYDPSHVKARLRVAKAMLYLNKPSQAMILVEMLCEECPKDTSLAELLSTCRKATQEQHGIFDLEAMRSEARRMSMRDRDMPFHADYACSKVDFGVPIRHVGGETFRGCMATEELQEGDLVSASKAFVYVQRDEPTSRTLEIDVYKQLLGTGKDVDITEATISRLQERPQIGETFYSLSAGPDFRDPVKSSDTGKLDIPRIRGVLRSNRFGADTNVDVLMNQCKRAKRENELGRQLTEEEAQEIFHNDSKGTGLWLRESLFNHSCAPNCSWSCIGDHLFVRANRPIAAGEELCLSYMDSNASYQQRAEAFSNWVRPGVGFQCVCECCTMLRSNPRLLEMEQEVDSAYKAASKLVATQKIPMGIAAEKTIPHVRRTVILSAFRELPLNCQHNTVARLMIMEGTCQQLQGDTQGALQSFERAAEIGYAIRGGSGHWNRAQDLWRIVGATLRATSDTKKATSILREIFQTTFAGVLPKSDLLEDFLVQSEKYVLPWWVDGFGRLDERVATLRQMARQACEDEAQVNRQDGKLSSSKKKRKQKGKGKK
jgi:tetratricopeptide (TPR) repeat protein